MKKISALLMLVALLAVLLLAGCGEDAEESTTVSSATPSQSSGTSESVVPSSETTTTAVQTTEQAPKEVIELKYASWSPSSSGMSKAEAEVFKKIEESSGGRIKITPYFDASLLPYDQIYMGTAKGQADLCKYVHSQNPNLNILNEVLDLPFLGVHSQEQAHEILMALREKYAELEEEYAKSNMKFLSAYYMPGYHLHLADKKEVRIPSDMKGMTIIGSNPFKAVVTAGGAALITPPVGEYYTSLERGLADGVMLHFAFIEAYKLKDVLEAHTLFGEGGALYQHLGFAMNLDVWNSLPADLQEIVQGAIQSYCEGAPAMVDAPQIERVMQQLRDQGNLFTELTDEELAQWQEAASPRWEEWVDSCVNKGYTEEQARNLLAEAEKLVAELAN